MEIYKITLAHSGKVHPINFSVKLFYIKFTVFNFRVRRLVTFFSSKVSLHCSATWSFLLPPSLHIHLLHRFTSNFYFQEELKLFLWLFFKPYTVTDDKGFPFPSFGHQGTLFFLQVVFVCFFPFVFFFFFAMLRQRRMTNWVSIFFLGKPMWSFSTFRVWDPEHFET